MGNIINICMSANGISHLANKRQRQEQKLALAKTKRAADGKRATLKKGNLPTLYASGGDNDTANRKLLQDGSTPLIPGRPWQ